MDIFGLSPQVGGGFKQSAITENSTLVSKIIITHVILAHTHHLALSIFQTLLAVSKKEEVSAIADQLMSVFLSSK